MTPEQRQEREIERNERWLRENVSDIGDVDTGRIKARVRIAVHEQWLRERLSDDSPPMLADKAKRAVRAALSRERSQARGTTATVPDRSVPHLRWWVRASGLAAAACLALWAGLYWTLGGQRDSGLAAVSSELMLVAAFEQFAEDDLSQSLALLADDVSEMEQTFDEVVLTETHDMDYEDLLDAIEEAQWDETTGDDWS